jgi:hypothetical protein
MTSGSDPVQPDLGISKQVGCCSHPTRALSHFQVPMTTNELHDEEDTGTEFEIIVRPNGQKFLRVFNDHTGLHVLIKITHEDIERLQATLEGKTTVV